MPTITKPGLSYTASAPQENGATIQLRPNGNGSITLTDTGSEFNPGDSITFSYNNGQLTGSATYLGTFTSGGVTYPFIYSPTFLYDAAGVFATVTGTFSQASLPCYVRGTAVETTRGPVAVEALAIGDEVVLARGGTAPIRWIGQRSFNGVFLRGRPERQPVCFRAGSLGGGLPRRDLYVSPEHAMFLDGVLVPACCLVNGRSIVHEAGFAQVDYFHVELDRHDVLLAEGAPSESFVDDDSRGAFHNLAEWEALNPDQPSKPAEYCAPRIEDGPRLEALRRRLDRVVARAA